MNPPAANHAVLLTPPGAAAIAVIRITGPAVPTFLSQHFSRPTAIARCTHGVLSDSEKIIDDPVVVLVTPEIADLNVHGGPWVVRCVLDLLVREHFELSPAPAHQPLPAIALDATTAIERDVEASLPLARTELAVRTLLSQPLAWAKLHDDPNPDAARRVLNDLALHHLLHPPRVAIVGPANVGKSTLANQLFAQDRSIVADLPGTTRDWVGALADIDGLAVTLIDTPGLRDTPDPIESAAITRSRQQIDSADLTLLVLDATRPLAEQSHLLAEHPAAITIVNKSDRPSADGIATVSALHTVAHQGGGVDEVRTAIAKHFHCHQIDPAVPRWWTANQRAWLATHLADEC